MKRSHGKRRERILTQSEPTKIRQTHGAIVLKQGDLVLLSEPGGDIPFHLPHGYGLFFRDCRFLDGLELRLNGERPTVLSDSARRGFETKHFLTNPGLRERNRPGHTIPTRRLGLERTRLARGDVVYERLQLSNFGQQPVRVQLHLRFRGCAKTAHASP
jgi:glycogen debranching enzyme